MVGIKRARRGLAEHLEQLGAVRVGRVVTLPDGLEFSEMKRDEHMPGKPPSVSKGIGGTTRQSDQGSAGETPSRFETITLPDGLEFRELSGAELASRLIKPKFTPNPVKRKCGRCERLRAYARRMLAKVSGTA